MPLGRASSPVGPATSIATSPSRWCQLAQTSLKIERRSPAGGGVVAETEADSPRIAWARITSSSTSSCASRSRSTGSSIAPFCSRRGDQAVELAAEADGLASVETPRSKPSSAIATAQPWPGSPTTRSASVRAPVKKTSLNSEPPVSCSIGRTSTPSWSSGTSRNDSPWCRSEPGSVRAITNTHWERCALDVHTFWPSITQSSAVEPGLGLHVGEVGAGVRLGVALRPELLDGHDPRQEPRLLLLGPERDQRRAEQLLAEVVDPGRRVGARVLLVEDHLLPQAEPAAAVLLRPAHAGPAVLGQQPVPGEPLLDAPRGRARRRRGRAARPTRRSGAPPASRGSRHGRPGPRRE